MTTLTKEELTGLMAGKEDLGSWSYAMTDPNFKGGIPALQALMLKTSARVEVIVDDGISKGVEITSLEKNCTVFFAKRKGDEESSTDEW